MTFTPSHLASRPSGGRIVVRTALVLGAIFGTGSTSVLAAEAAGASGPSSVRPSGRITSVARQVLATNERRVPGFEVVEISKPAVRTNPLPTFETKLEATSPVPPEVRLPTSSGPAPGTGEDLATRTTAVIPTMVIPQTPPGAVPPPPPWKPKTASGPRTIETLFGEDPDASLRGNVPSVEPRRQESRTASTEPYAGVWYKKTLSDCRSRVDDDTHRMLLHLGHGRFDFYESHCTFRSVNNSGSTYKIAARCTSEGIASESTITIKMMDADKLTINAYEAAGIKGWTYRRCPSQRAGDRD